MIFIAVPVEICACGFVRMVLVNEVKRTVTVTELSVTGTCGRRGEVWLQHRRGKRGKVERGVDLMERGTHSELMHSNALNPNDSPLSLYRYMVTKAAIRFHLIAAGGWVRMSAVAEQPREETLDDVMKPPSTRDSRQS